MGSNCVLVTGSSQGLGKALALCFASHGWDVVVHGQDKVRTLSVKGQILDSHPEVKCEACIGDIIDGQSTIALLSTMACTMGVSLLINNAGVYLKEKLDALNPYRIQKILNTNLLAPILLTQKMFELFKEKKSGTVININSVAGKIPSPYESVYCASKHGLRGFMGSFKHEALKYNVVVVDVYLGAMATEMTRGRPDWEKFIGPVEAAEAIYGLAEKRDTLRVSEVDLFRRNY